MFKIAHVICGLNYRVAAVGKESAYLLNCLHSIARGFVVIAWRVVTLLVELLSCMIKDME
jgi:hypothetical protein